MTTAAPTPTSGGPNWMQTVVLTLSIALLGLTLTPPAAQAADSDPSANATFQILLCEAGGGTATVDSTRTGNGLAGVQVTCQGGTFDGMDCFNSAYGTTCTGAHPNPVPRDAGSHVWQLDEVLPVLESGSVEQMHDILADLEAANEGGQDVAPAEIDQRPDIKPSVAASDDDQDKDKAKSKKGKKGKKGGKGRKK